MESYADFIEYMDYENLLRFSCFDAKVAAKWHETRPPKQFIVDCITNARYPVLEIIPHNIWPLVWRYAAEAGNLAIFRHYLAKKEKSLVYFAANSEYSRELLELFAGAEYIYTNKFVLKIILNSKINGDLVGKLAFRTYVIRNRDQIAELVGFLAPDMQQRLIKFLSML